MIKWLKECWDGFWFEPPGFQIRPTVEMMEYDFKDYGKYQYQTNTIITKPFLSNLRHSMRKG